MSDKKTVTVQLNKELDDILTNEAKKQFTSKASVLKRQISKMKGVDAE